MARIAACGSWISPITAELAASAAISFSDLQLDGEDLYWSENRPAENGRCAILQRGRSGGISERTPTTFSARSKVHEYGGGSYCVIAGSIFFVNYSDQRIYRQEPDGLPSPITSDNGCRHADLIVDHRRRRLLCIQEDHSHPGEPTNTIAAVQMDGGGCSVLVSGNDFYSNPRLSPDGTQLAYLTWNHPCMPWDGCELYLAAVSADGVVGASRRVAGGSTEAVLQPEWSPGGVLHFISDSTGWWNLYQWRAGATRALFAMPAEFGRAMWSFGYSSYGFASEHRILCSYTECGVDHLAWLDTEAGTLAQIECPYAKVDSLRCGQGTAAFIGASSILPPTVVRLDPRTSHFEAVRAAFVVNVDPAYLSQAAAVEWIGADGHEAHGLYYPPTNPEFAPPATERPPLLVLSHSGPTSAASTALRYALQFWTSRGFAVLDVNYSGSTGYGREYRQRLNGQWGVKDVQDCCDGALYLVQEGLADRERMAIKGSSAGGFTTYACLAFRNDVFRAGSAHSGVADLEIAARNTHKFESHYFETLIGPYPERRDIYLDRSPIRHAQDFRCALLLFHGDDDRVVPPAQSQEMFDALRQRGLPMSLLRFSGEGHGFRRADTLRRIHEAELYFFSRIFGFEPPDKIEPIPIENLPQTG